MKSAGLWREAKTGTPKRPCSYRKDGLCCLSKPKRRKKTFKLLDRSDEINMPLKNVLLCAAACATAAAARTDPGIAATVTHHRSLEGYPAPHDLTSAQDLHSELLWRAHSIARAAGHRLAPAGGGAGAPPRGRYSPRTADPPVIVSQPPRHFSRLTCKIVMAQWVFLFGGRVTLGWETSRTHGLGGSVWVGSTSLKRSHRVSTLRPRGSFECECRCAQHF